MKLFFGILATLVIAFLIDLAWGHYAAYREREALRIRDAQLRKWNITAFRGTKERQL